MIKNKKHISAIAAASICSIISLSALATPASSQCNNYLASSNLEFINALANNPSQAATMNAALTQCQQQQACTQTGATANCQSKLSTRLFESDYYSLAPKYTTAGANGSYYMGNNQALPAALPTMQTTQSTTRQNTTQPTARANTKSKSNYVAPIINSNVSKSPSKQQIHWF